MITIETDKVVIYNGQEFKVSNGGDFSETDLVNIYKADDPEKNPIYALQAYFVHTGTIFTEES
jgi:hypothetical protein